MDLLSSGIIIFFLPAALILYYGAGHFNNRTAQKLILCTVSLLFYLFFGYIPFIIMFAEALADRYLSVKLSEKKSKALLAFAISLNVLVLLLFKYLNFFAGNVSLLAGKTFTPFDLIMPVGISYITFSQIAYLVDSYRGETKNVSFIDYMIFVFFFPKIMLGPICLHEDIIPALNDKKRFKINPENMGIGLMQFTTGMAKKLLIVPHLSSSADFGFAYIPNLTSADAWFFAIVYMLQIYLDFSGYCDIACGIAKLFNIDLPMNFDSPYKMISVSDYWARWHLTLTRFLRKYIYFPLGGNRKGKFRTYVNVMIIFLISGFWHGANWTYIFWGGLHGLCMVFEKMFKKQLEKIPTFIRWVVTAPVIALLWVFFRCETIGEAFEYIRKMFSFNSILPSPVFCASLDFNDVPFIQQHLNIAMPLFVAAVYAGCVFIPNISRRKYKANTFNLIVTIVLFALSFICISDVTPFIYFKF